MSYDPVRRECRLSRYDQTGSRIVYDPEHDYYENLIGESGVITSRRPRLSSIINLFVLMELSEPNIKSQFVFHQQNINKQSNTITFLLCNEVL